MSEKDDITIGTLGMINVSEKNDVIIGTAGLMPVIIGTAGLMPVFDSCSMSWTMWILNIKLDFMKK